MANPNSSLGDDDEIVVTGEEQEEQVFVADGEDKEAKGADKGTAGADDERLGADPDAETDAEKEARRKARRERRQKKKIYERRDRTELDYLRQRNLELESRLDSTDKKTDSILARTEVGRIDSARAQLQQRLNEVDDVIAAAIENSDGSEVAKANKLRDDIRDKLQELNRVRSTHVAVINGDADDEGEPRSEARGREQPADDIKKRSETARRNATVFQGRHDWFDGKNEDSQVALKLDRELRGEGLQPDTADFWNELEDRLKDKIPHRFKDVDDDEDDDEEDEERTPRSGKAVKDGAKGGPKITGINGQRVQVNGKSGQLFRISAERKKAMQDAGLWDDVPVRNRMLKRYAEHDKQNSKK